jgi:hypothetical protein
MTTFGVGGNGKGNGNGNGKGHGNGIHAKGAAFATFL